MVLKHRVCLFQVIVYGGIVSFDFDLCLQIRPIDKKLQYQIQKLTSTKLDERTIENLNPSEKLGNVSRESEDLLRYRPNPDMLVNKADVSAEVTFFYLILVAFALDH